MLRLDVGAKKTSGQGEYICVVGVCGCFSGK